VDPAELRETALGRLALQRRPHYNLKDIAADFIREAIVSGEFAPRTKVDQDEIAEVLGISRVPVREALIELTQKGFVVAVPRRGAFVAEVVVEDIEDYYEVLAMVFSLATRRALGRLTPADLKDLRRLHGEIASTGDNTRRRELDREFLNVINRAGSSSRLESILQFLGGALPGSFYYDSPVWAATEAKYRELMLDALERGDAEMAAKVSQDHMHESAQVTIDHLRSRGYWSDR
jgi:DNA-binding GntR family transcriptional regulator